MNELQQVLLIFAVVVIAGLYFLSRSRQNQANQSNNPSAETNHSKPQNTKPLEHTISDTASINEVTDGKEFSAPAHEKAAAALNELGEPHIPVSEATEKRVIESFESDSASSSGNASNQPETPSDSNQQQTDPNNPNQGMLSFGEDFDLPEPNTAEEPSQNPAQNKDSTSSETATQVQQDQKQSNEDAGKHHVLVVDDPGMNGEIDTSSLPPEHIKPSFGIPEDKIKPKAVSATGKKPEVFVILVMSSTGEFEMPLLNQALLGVGLKMTDQQIFSLKDNMGNDFIRVANMLEPGTFPTEELDKYSTPGVAMILELPTSVRAPKAMHELIMMARKVSQRLNGRLYNMERQLVKESDLQSMRDAALDYESEPLA